MAFAPYDLDITDYDIFTDTQIKELALQYDSVPATALVAIYVLLQAQTANEDPDDGAGRLRVAVNFTTGNPEDLFIAENPVSGLTIDTNDQWYAVTASSPHTLEEVTYDPTGSGVTIDADHQFDSPDAARIIRSFSYFWTDD